MELSTKLPFMNTISPFLAGAASLSHSLPAVLPPQRRRSPDTTAAATSASLKPTILQAPPFTNPHQIPSKSTSSASESHTITAARQEEGGDEELELLFSDHSSGINPKRGNKNPAGASSISSGVRLENVSKSYDGVTVLKDINWEVTRGEKVGLVGVNGAGKTTQLRIISGFEEPDSGNVIKAKNNMKIAFLSQEFEVLSSRTVREELSSALEEEMEVSLKLERVQKAIEKSVDDLELMGRLLDEFDSLQKRAQAVDLNEVDVKINKLLPALGFSPKDADKNVGSFSGGWQMRISLGKILLQDPDLLLLDEPTNHLDLDTIEWLEGYLKKEEVPMVIISHDRAFLDQLCTKIVETDMGVSRTYEGKNYSDYVIAKAAWVEALFTTWEKQQKEIEHTRDLIGRLSAGANAGRASTAEKVHIHLIVSHLEFYVVPLRFTIHPYFRPQGSLIVL